MNQKLFLVAICLVVTFNARTSADFDFDIGSSHYRVVTSGQDWVNAASIAATTSFNRIAGTLARIETEEENSAIMVELLANISPSEFSNTIAPDGGGGAYVWLGGTDRNKESAWIWDGDNDGVGEQFWAGDENGSPVNELYNNFGTTGSQNEPDNFGAGQDALGISLNGWPLGSASQWNDVNESNGLYYLIEFENANQDCTVGDVNLDGNVDLLDVNPFVALVSSGEFLCEADTNQDGAVDLLDVTPFVDLLSGQ